MTTVAELMKEQEELAERRGYWSEQRRIIEAIRLFDARLTALEKFAVPIVEEKLKAEVKDANPPDLRPSRNDQNV